jgi:hypothetical protein
VEEILTYQEQTLHHTVTPGPKAAIVTPLTAEHS